MSEVGAARPGPCHTSEVAAQGPRGLPASKLWGKEQLLGPLSPVRILRPRGEGSDPKPALQ